MKTRPQEILEEHLAMIVRRRNYLLAMIAAASKQAILNYEKNEASALLTAIDLIKKEIGIVRAINARLRDRQN